MAYEHEQAGRGTLSRNPRKWGASGMLPDANPKAPDYTGKLRINAGGQEVLLYLSGWARKGEDGTPFVSVAVEYPHNSGTRLTVACADAEDDGLPKFPATQPTPVDDDPLPF